MDYRQQISDYIDSCRADMTALLVKLASIPSILEPGEENMPYGPAVDRALRTGLEEAQRLGLKAGDFEHKMGLVDLNDHPHNLAILCHLDVVPAVPEGWDTPPFAPAVKGELIFGRGVSDNKGPAVAALYAMKAVKELKIPLKHNARLFLGGCEENGSRDLQAYLEKHSLPPFSFTPDGCFPVGNAERGRIILTATRPVSPKYVTSIHAGLSVNAIPDRAVARLRGIRLPDAERLVRELARTPCSITQTGDTVELTVFGTSTHAAHPSWGENALTSLLGILAQLEDGIFAQLASCFPHGKFAGEGLGITGGGIDLSLTRMDLEGDAVTLWADGRIDLDKSARAMANTITKTVPFPVEFPTLLEPHFVPESEETVTALNKVYEAYTGRTGGTYTLDAMTYAHHSEHTVIFGGVLPGDRSGNAHGINECFDLNTMTEAAKIFAGVIVTLCAQ